MKIYVVIKTNPAWDATAADIVYTYLDPGMADERSSQLEAEELDINTRYRVEAHEVN